MNILNFSLLNFQMILIFSFTILNHKGKNLNGYLLFVLMYYVLKLLIRYNEDLFGLEIVQDEMNKILKEF